MTPTDPNRLRLRRWAIGTLLAASAVSLAGNVQHELLVYSGATSLIFAVAWAAVPPLALPLAVHLAGLMLTGGARLRRTIAAAVAMVAAIAFTVSFINLRALTEAMGSGSITAILFPLLVDLLAAISTVALLAQHGAPAADPVHHIDQDHTAVVHQPVHDAVLDAAPAPLGPAAAPDSAPAPAPGLDWNDASTGDIEVAVDAPADARVDQADAPAPAPAQEPASSPAEVAQRLVQRGVTRIPLETVTEVLVRRQADPPASQNSIARDLGINRRTVAGLLAAAEPLTEPELEGARA